jgi:hypothetical protein
MKKNKTLNKLKAKRAKYNIGGYGYVGSKTKADSIGFSEANGSSFSDLGSSSGYGYGYGYGDSGNNTNTGEDIPDVDTSEEEPQEKNNV